LKGIIVQTTIPRPIIPIGEILKAYKQHKKDMEEIGLGEAGTHPIEVFVVAVQPGIENPHEGEFFFDVGDARVRRNAINEVDGEGSAGIYKVKVEVNK
jgi:hypothetical protein